MGACVRVCACACACRAGRGGGGGSGWENIARSKNQSDHKIVKYRPFTNRKKIEKVMVSYNRLREDPYGEKLQP